MLAKHSYKNLKKSSWKKNIFIPQKKRETTDSTFVNINDKIEPFMVGNTYFWNKGKSLRSIIIKKGRINYKFRHIHSKLS